MDAFEPGLIRHDAVLLLVLRAPLDPFSRDLPAVFRHLRERHLPGRQHVEPLVAEHADVELPAVDELFHDRRCLEFLVDERHPARELIVILDHRGLRDPRRGLEEKGLDDERERQTLGERHFPAWTNDRELGDANPVVRQQLFRQRLVPGEDQATRITSRVRQAQKLEIADDVLIEGRHPGECLHEVEHDVRLEEPDGRPDAAEVVIDAEHANVVADLAQRLDDVVLHLPLGLEDVDTGRVLGGNEVVVHEREDAQLLHGCSTDRFTGTIDDRHCAGSSSPAR